MRHGHHVSIGALLALSACGPATSEPDAFVDLRDASSRDAGTVDAPGDASRPSIDGGIDAPLAIDAASTDDAFVDPDAAPSLDAFMPDDAFAAADAFVAPDAFADRDAFTPPDAFSPPDAFVPSDAFRFMACVAPDLAVPTPPTPPALVISEIDPGTFIEVYNTTSSPIALGGTSYQLCSPFVYAALSTLAPSTTVPPRGYASLPWPPGFADTEAGGEVSLYTDAVYADPAAVMSFVCWGTNPHGTRKSTAESGGRWSGACAGAISAGRSIARRPSTTGTLAADWATDAVPTPETCGP